MPTMKVHPPLSDNAADAVARLSASLALTDIIASILVRRGIDTPEKARNYLECPLDTLSDPMGLYGMGSAASRIVSAVRRKEPILVFGDYDADGVSATCLMVEFLRDCGAVVSSHIPHRITDGYGFHPDNLHDDTVPEGTRLIVTVDCGVTSHDAVTAAAGRGIDVVITDHHDVGSSIPPAISVINPKQPGCTSGLDHLAGVGVAFYLAIAVRAGLREAGHWSSGRTEPNMMAYVDLVALGTLADMVPLIRENRVLVRRGLQLMRTGLRPGLAALSGSGQSAFLSGDDVTFRLAPPINAAGRLRHADRALHLLLCRDNDSAGEMARHLLDLNTRRKALERRILDEATAALAAAGKDPVAIVLADAKWHLGVLGIVASRLSTRHGCPAILFTRNGDHWKGSGRSPEGIDIMACLNRCSDGIHAFGGHPAAAGLTLEEDQMTAFSARFTQAVTQELATRRVPLSAAADLEIPLSAVTPQLADQLQALEPFGPGNPEPVFISRHLSVVSVKTMGEHHCRLTVAPIGAAGGPRVNAVHFNTPRCPSPGDALDTLAYHIRWNHWNGRRTIQLLVVSLENAT